MNGDDYAITYGGSKLEIARSDGDYTETVTVESGDFIEKEAVSESDYYEKTGEHTYRSGTLEGSVYYSCTSITVCRLKLEPSSVKQYNCDEFI